MVAAGKADWHLFDYRTKMCEADLTTQAHEDVFKQNSEV